MVNIIMIVGIGLGVLVLVGVGLFVWLWLKSRNNKSFPFILYGRNGRDRWIIQAKVKIDPANRSNKRFFFDKLDSPLEVRNPTAFVNGIPHREITFNNRGEYTYTNPLEVDDKDFLKVALEPEEKTLALHRLKENTVRYEKSLDKAQAVMLITGFVLVLMIMIGIVYSTISYVSASKDLVTMAKENTAVASASKQVAETNRLVSEQLASIAAALTGNANITRAIS